MPQRLKFFKQFIFILIFDIPFLPKLKKKKLKMKSFIRVVN